MSKVAGFAKRHKKLIIVLSILLVLAIAVAVLVSNVRKSLSQLMQQQPDTTVLARTELQHIVTATGMLESATKRDVTSSLTYEITQVLVKEGDNVIAGQLLVNLDLSDLEQQIADAQKTLANAEANDAQTMQQAQRKLADAQNQLSIDTVNLQKAVDEAKTAQTQARAVFDPLYQQQQVNMQWYALDKDASEKNRDAADKKTTLDNTPKVDPTLPDDDPVNAAYKAALDAYNAADEVARTAQAALDAYLIQYPNAPIGPDATVFEKAKSTCDAADQALDKAIQTYDATIRQDNITIESCRDAIKSAQLNPTATKASDSLKTLLDQRAKASIVAPISGTVTAVNATVGKNASTAGVGAATSSSVSTALFTIADTANLQIPASVPEYDAVNIEPGMPVDITSDAVNGQTWQGIVKSVSPAATDTSGNFTATVSVTSAPGDLAIGMSAKMNIVLESKPDVYAVPYDAVVKNEAGEDVVYVYEPAAPGAQQSGSAPAAPTGGMVVTVNNGQSTSGSGQTGFVMPVAGREIVVQTGMESDYLIEITSDELHDGMEILNDPEGRNVSNSNFNGMMVMGGAGG